MTTMIEEDKLLLRIRFELGRSISVTKISITA